MPVESPEEIRVGNLVRKPAGVHTWLSEKNTIPTSMMQAGFTEVELPLMP